MLRTARLEKLRAGIPELVVVQFCRRRALCVYRDYDAPLVESYCRQWGACYATGG